MKRQPLILAFVQPDWFRRCGDKKLLEAQELYAYVIKWQAVMLRSPEGKKLQRYFKDLFDNVVWRCANPARPVSTEPGKDYDVAHIKAVLKQYGPDIVIAFGQTCGNGITAATGFKAIPFKLIMATDIFDKNIKHFSVDWNLINVCIELRVAIEKLSTQIT